MPTKKKYFFFSQILEVHLYQSLKIKIIKNCRNQGFSSYFSFLMEGSASGSVQIITDPDPGGPKVTDPEPRQTGF
jgi:hypothetical protein